MKIDYGKNYGLLIKWSKFSTETFLRVYYGAFTRWNIVLRIFGYGLEWRQGKGFSFEGKLV